MDYTQAQVAQQQALYANQITLNNANFTQHSAPLYPLPHIIHSTSSNPLHTEHANRAAAIIDPKIALSANPQYSAAAPLHHIHPYTFMHNVPQNQYFVHHPSFGACHPHIASNINIHDAHYVPRHSRNAHQRNDEYAYHKNQYDRHERNDRYHPAQRRNRSSCKGRDYRFDKYTYKYNGFRKYNKAERNYDKYEDKNSKNMSYYDDHENGRSQRDRNKNKVVSFSTTNVYVNGIPRNWRSDQVQDYFSRYGTILSVNLWQDHATGCSRGSGFVDFKNPYSAEKCIKEMKGMHFKNCKPLIIKYADVRRDKHEERRRHLRSRSKSRFTRSRSRSRSRARYYSNEAKCDPNCSQSRKYKEYDTQEKENYTEQKVNNELKHQDKENKELDTHQKNKMMKENIESKECELTNESIRSLSKEDIDLDDKQISDDVEIEKSPSISSDFSNIEINADDDDDLITESEEKKHDPHDEEEDNSVEQKAGNETNTNIDEDQENNDVSTNQKEKIVTEDIESKEGIRSMSEEDIDLDVRQTGDYVEKSASISSSFPNIHCNDVDLERDLNDVNHITENDEKDASEF